MKIFFIFLTAVLLLTVSCSSPNENSEKKELDCSLELERKIAELRAKELEMELIKQEWVWQADSLNKVIKKQETEILQLKGKLKQNK